MYTTTFEYHRAGSVEEALDLLALYGDDAKLLAGGHSLIPVMKLRFARPAHLIDIRRIAGLAGIREENGAIVIGATTTHRTVESSELIRTRVPMLAEAAGEIGDPQVRNMGTIGGSVAHADPAADLPAVLLALDAEFRARGPEGTRAIPADGFFLGLMTTALDPAEILTEVRIPIPPGRSSGAYVKHPHPASRFAIVGVAALVTLGDDDRIERVRVGITGLDTRARRATTVETALAGTAGEPTDIEAAAAHAADGLTLRDDAQGPVEYKAELAKIHTARALSRAIHRARGG